MGVFLKLNLPPNVVVFGCLGFSMLQENLTMIPAPHDPDRKRKVEAFDRLLTVMDELRLN
jgi:hypothetical protein